MKTPNTTAELADAIESLVASYMDSVRDAAQQALSRGLANAAAVKRSSSTVSRPKGAVSSPSMGRRTAAELREVCDTLCERVRAQPGASMVELAAQMGADVTSLQLPMSKLKSAGRVRSVGQRHLTRYYPAVVRRADGAA